jgi:hypothetical protein
VLWLTLGLGFGFLALNYSPWYGLGIAALGLNLNWVDKNLRCFHCGKKLRSGSLRETFMALPLPETCPHCGRRDY